MDAPAETHLCPHCKKAFQAALLGPHTARAGFKCPHCRLFVPIARAPEAAPEAA
jgi:hypothetical protein